jgi:hypothetical protein
MVMEKNIINCILGGSIQKFTVTLTLDVEPPKAFPPCIEHQTTIGENF